MFVTVVLILLKPWAKADGGADASRAAMAAVRSTMRRVRQLRFTDIDVYQRVSVGRIRRVRRRRSVRAGPDANARLWQLRDGNIDLYECVSVERIRSMRCPGCVLASTDAGRTWSPLAGTPALVLVTVQPGGSTWGLDRNGAVHRRTATASWESIGTVQGRPEAFAASADRLFAATAKGIFESRDGKSWSMLYATPD